MTAEANWRRHWELYDKAGSGAAKHLIGLLFQITSAFVDLEGLEKGWCINGAPEPAELVDELEAKMGPSEYAQWLAELQHQAITLWCERHGDEPNQ